MGIAEWASVVREAKANLTSGCSAKEDELVVVIVVMVVVVVVFVVVVVVPVAAILVIIAALIICSRARCTVDIGSAVDNGACS